ncbi:VOC family protein [Blastopirellula sp. JC732]|uniref:VOC family protein n=1 Tax=Blastopirellula sediminis TaxID=2894196 RepID=A0A9X1MMC6_9BACT|nr:glyoxalase superfamily protein [Blastopirellula sediminis]MCC9607418.1 VOC family protein [Blastopirellula sediminis]MCC9629289.1 VOC family protein [Blastopirellula sediminis]
MNIVFQQTIPVLRIFDVAKAKEFYVDFLGFAVDWEHRFHEKAPLYMQVSRAGLILHLSEHHGDSSPGANVFIWMTGVEALHAELIAKGYAYNCPSVEKTFYNSLCMKVVDPFHNTLQFNEEIKLDGEA